MCEDSEPTATNQQDDCVDENMVLFVYGNLKIVDVDTGEVLVNKRF